MVAMTGGSAAARCHHTDALERLGVLDALVAFDPHVAGTPPLGLDMPGSDIDILCHAPDATEFTRRIWDLFGGQGDFRVWQWRRSDRPVIASFTAEGWAFEIFGGAEPVRDQAGWKHFVIERRLLDLGGARLRAAIMARRTTGMKTEPAVWSVLGLTGDPYAGLLALHGIGDGELRCLLIKAGFEQVRHEGA